MNRYNIYVLLAALILLSTSAFALYPFSQQSCAGTACANSFLGNDFGSASFYGNSMNVINTQNSTSYAMCILNTGSIYRALVGQIFTDTGAASDFNPNIVITESTTSIAIYDKTCVLLDRITLPHALTAPPILTDIDGNFQNEIATVIGNITFYQYNMTGSAFQVLAQFQNRSTYKSLDCFRPQTEAAGFRNFETCTSLDARTPFNKIFITSFSGIVPWLVQFLDVENTTGQITGNSNSFSGVYNNLQGTAVIDNFFNYYVPTCFVNNNVQCSAYDMEGFSRFNESYGAIANYNELLQHDNYVAKVDSTWRVITSYFGDTSGNRAYDKVVTMIMDLSGDTKYSSLSSGNASNIVVGDYNHSGLNKMCMISGISSTSPRFICMDAFGNIANGINYSAIPIVTGLPKLNQDYLPIAMGTYIYGSGQMQLFTYNGIWNYDGSNFTNIFQTNITADDDMTGFPVVVQGDTGAPLSIYADESVAFIIYDTAAISSCGNGICDALENGFICPADCNGVVLNASNCTTNFDCHFSAPFLKCVGQRCVQPNIDNTTPPCLVDSDCPYTAPICYANSCVKAFLGPPPPGLGINTPPPTTAAGQPFNMAYWFDLIFQSNNKLKMIFAISLIVIMMLLSFMAVIGFAAMFNHRTSPSETVAAMLIGGMLAFIFDISMGLLAIWWAVIVFVGIPAVYILYSKMLHPNPSG